MFIIGLIPSQFQITTLGYYSAEKMRSRGRKGTLIECLLCARSCKILYLYFILPLDTLISFFYFFIFTDKIPEVQEHVGVFLEVTQKA